MYCTMSDILYKKMDKKDGFWIKICIFRRKKKKTVSMMKKFLIAGSLALFMCFSSLFVGQTALTAKAESEMLNLSCKSAYCIDATSATPVYAFHETQRLPIASMCKIMTLILSFDAVKSGKLDYDTVVPVSEHAMSMGGSQVYLEAGGQYTAEQLMESVTVCSANDACVALAEYIAGSDDLFVQKMNERAKGLGCGDTLFANCTGLPKDPQYSCAHDVALMLRELILNEKYFQFAGVWTDEFQHPEGRTTLITNTNKLIRQYQGCDGGKTGFTNEAGFCLAATAKRGDTRVISVCIGSPDSKSRFAAVSRMFDYTFANYADREVYGTEPLDEKLSIKNGKVQEISVMPEAPVRYFCKIGAEDATITRDAQFFSVSAPLKKGDKVGEMTVYKDGVEYAKVSIVSCEDAEKANYFDYCRRAAENWAI